MRVGRFRPVPFFLGRVRVFVLGDFRGIVPLPSPGNVPSRVSEPVSVLGLGMLVVRLCTFWGCGMCGVCMWGVCVVLSCVLSCAIFTNTQKHKHKHTNTQTHKHTKTQKHKNTQTHKHTNPGCSVLDPGTCVACASCPAGTARGGCGTPATSAGACITCSACPADQYRSACSPTASCLACSTCPAGQYMFQCGLVAPFTSTGVPVLFCLLCEFVPNIFVFFCVLRVFSLVDFTSPL